MPLTNASAAPRQRVARPYAPSPQAGYQPTAAEPVEHPSDGGRRLVLVPGGRSDVLVRGLMDKDGNPRDPWAEVLADVRELPVDADARERIGATLDGQVQRAPMLDTAPQPASAHDDPAQDAFGGSRLQSHRSPLAVGPSGS